MYQTISKGSYKFVFLCHGWENKIVSSLLCELVKFMLAYKKIGRCAFQCPTEYEGAIGFMEIKVHLVIRVCHHLGNVHSSGDVFKHCCLWELCVKLNKSCLPPKHEIDMLICSQNCPTMHLFSLTMVILLTIKDRL